MIMSVIAWIVLGFIAGFVASKLAGNRGDGLPFNILLGMVGAVIGGWVFNATGGAGVTGLNVWSLMVSVIAAVLFLVVWHVIRRSTAPSLGAPDGK